MQRKTKLKVDRVAPKLQPPQKPTAKDRDLPSLKEFVSCLSNDEASSRQKGRSSK